MSVELREFCREVPDVAAAAAHVTRDASRAEKSSAVLNLVEALGDRRRNTLHHRLGGIIDLIHFSSPFPPETWKALAESVRMISELYTILEGLRASRHAAARLDYVPSGTYTESVFSIWRSTGVVKWRTNT